MERRRLREDGGTGQPARDGPFAYTSQARGNLQSVVRRLISFSGTGHASDRAFSSWHLRLAVVGRSLGNSGLLLLPTELHHDPRCSAVFSLCDPATALGK